MSENKPFKLNLWALKKETSEKQPEEILNLQNTQNSEENIPLEKKAHSLDLSQMKSRRIKKEEIKEKSNNKIVKKEEIEIVGENHEEENQEVFSNYESEFKKEKETILQKIEKFKNFVSPKTRLWFIAMLIWVTILWIASLFIINPEIHNVKNYEANLLFIKQKIECKVDKTKCIKKETNKTIKKEIVQINNKTLKKEIFVIEYKTQIIDWKEKIIYKWNKYSKEQFDKKIKEIIRLKKLEKLQNYLKNIEKTNVINK